jgi:hypothetical protein
VERDRKGEMCRELLYCYGETINIIYKMILRVESRERKRRRLFFWYKPCFVIIAATTTTTIASTVFDLL